MVKETAEIKAVKSELKELWIETKGLYREAMRKHLEGTLEAAEVDKLTKLLSSLRALKEISYSIYDIATWKEKKDVQLRTEDLELRKEVAEIKSELELLKIGG